MSFFTNKKPRVGLYILVWFLAFVPSNIAVSLLDTFLSGAIIKSVDDLNNYAFTCMIMHKVCMPMHGYAR